MRNTIMYSISLLLVVLIVADCTGKKEKLNEVSVLGQWYTVKGSVDAISFQKDNRNYIYSGIRDNRPVAIGTWKIHKDKFMISRDNGTLTEYSFTLSNDTLIFNGGEEIYTKTPPLEIRFPEARILKDLSKAFSSHRFTNPLPVKFSWGIWDETSHSMKIQELTGYGFAVASSLNSNDMEDLSGFISDHGFTKDSLFKSDICRGFWDEKQVVTLCAGQGAGFEGDSVGIVISSGFIK